MQKTYCDRETLSRLLRGSRNPEPTMGIPSLKGWFSCLPSGKLVRYEERRKATKKDLIHFYTADRKFLSFLEHPGRRADELRGAAGIIGPDPTILAHEPLALQIEGIFWSRAVSAYCESLGIPVVPNIRWGDRESFRYAFFGIPLGSVVAIGTLGLMKRRKGMDGMARFLFKEGLKQVVERIRPKAILVYGSAPEDIFGPYRDVVPIHRYPSQIEIAHSRKEEN